MKIAVLGAGNIGGAIAVGVIKKGVVRGRNVTVTARTIDTLLSIESRVPSIRCTTDNIGAIKGADYIFLAVKPWILPSVVEQIKDFVDYSSQSIVSVVAGVDFNALTAMLDNGKGVKPTIYRVIPNTAISLAKSVTYISCCRATDANLEGLKRILEPLGQNFIIDESLMVAGTSLASCGIAFALKYIDASIKGGVELGFSEQDSRDMVMATMEGALELLRKNMTLPQQEIDKVTTEGGLTFKGLEAMSSGGFETSVIDGLKKSR
ncbi:MAG: pyrroline-5-carboxylate reductase dimerization domain-containing protein [Rikenellaceae bacterium]